MGRTRVTVEKDYTGWLVEFDPGDGSGQWVADCAEKWAAELVARELRKRLKKKPATGGGGQHA